MPRASGLMSSRLCQGLLAPIHFTPAEGCEVVEGLPPAFVDALFGALFKNIGGRTSGQAPEHWLCMLLE